LGLREELRVSDTVEREVLIEAPAEVVWGVITEPVQIERWFADSAEVDPSPAADGRLMWRPGGRGGNNEVESIFPIRVVDAEPFHRFSFRWNHPEGSAPDERNSALVEFSLSEEAGVTRLRVVESGIDAVARGAQERARYLESHKFGWEKHLGELLTYMDAKSSGSVS
jgi:uncharacterized protein YndB with AHSA1/START domain